MHPNVHCNTIYTQPRHGSNPSVHQQMNGQEDMVHTYNGILLSHKQNKLMTFIATWVDLEIVILSEVTQTQKDTYPRISLICRT